MTPPFVQLPNLSWWYRVPLADYFAYDKSNCLHHDYLNQLPNILDTVVLDDSLLQNDGRRVGAVIL